MTARCPDCRGPRWYKARRCRDCAIKARHGGPGFSQNGWRGANPARSPERQAIGACAAYAEEMWRVVESLERALKPND